MGKQKNLVISMAAGVLSCLLVYGVYVLQLRQVDLQQSIAVVAAKQFIPAGEIVKEGMLELQTLFKASYSSEMYTRLEQVAGQEALIPIGKGEPVLVWKVDRYALLPSEEQATFQIPKEYVLSISNGIRAGDKVRIYVSGEGGKSRRLFEREITVASVKTSANIEIDDPKNSNLLSRANSNIEEMYLSRRNANGAIDRINLNLTEQEWLTLDRHCKEQGVKLVIAFVSASITELEGGFM